MIRLLIVFIFVVIILVFIFDCIGVAWNTREKKFVDTFPPLSPIFLYKVSALDQAKSVGLGAREGAINQILGGPLLDNG